VNKQKSNGKEMFMKPQLKKAALAVLIALGTAAAPAMAACPADGAKPFKAGPVDPVNGFATYVQDSQGLALELCLAGDGNGICFFDPAIPNNQFSQLIGFGPEAFWWLAEGDVATTRVDALVVMAAEAAFAAEDPAPGEQFPFTRLRIRIDVTDPGVYTLTHPYGQHTWEIDQALIDATGGVRVVNESFDIQFAPDAMNQGRVGPWLVNEGAPFADPLGGGGSFVGNGTPLPATGSPCGTNFIRLAAKAPDGVAPLNIDPTDQDLDGSTASVSTNLFTIFGKHYVGTVPTPLAAAASYTRATDGSGRVSVFATAPTTATVTATVGGNVSNMVQEGDRYFLSVPLGEGPVPAVSVTADNDPPLANNLDSTASPAVTDVVTITRAEATCSGGTCTLVVEASSSDLSGTPPALTVAGLQGLQDPPLPVPVSVPVSVVPATVTVQSSAGGTDTEPVKVINQ
jgi:hypothetical protein